MEFKSYKRRSLIYEAVQITKENLDVVAKLIDSRVQPRPNRKRNKVIIVNSDVIPYVRQIHRGWWITRIGNVYNAYSNTIFTKEFVEVEKG